MEDHTYHKPVLLKETVELLDPKEGDAILDCTVGAGGHAIALAKLVGKTGSLTGLDEDHGALEIAKAELIDVEPKLYLLNENFRNLDKIGEKFDRILFDLGMSSMDIELSGRGFSLLRDEPLLMTLKSKVDESTLTARDVVNSWSEKSLVDIIYGYGGEKFAKRIAKAIVERREERPIETSMDLANVVEGAVPDWYKRRRIHPATKTFQAIRIAVNDELGALTEGIEKAWQALRSSGRIAVISFHELEDRIVKRKFREYAKSSGGRLITKKPVVPTHDEVLQNPRSRSAKLRVIEKIQ